MEKGDKSGERLSPNEKDKRAITIRLLCLVQLSLFSCTNVLTPFFTKEVSGRDSSSLVSGFIFSIYGWTMFTSTPCMGILAIRAGAKRLLLIGMLVVGICNIIFGFIGYVQDNTAFLAGCSVVRIGEALGAAAMSTASYTIIAETYPHQVGRKMGIMDGFVGLGICIGPCFGAYLYDVAGYGPPFFAVGSVMLVIIPFIAALLPAAELTQKPSTLRNILRGMLKLVQNRKIAMLLLTTSMLSAVWGFFDPILEPHFQVFNIPSRWIGFVFLTVSIPYTISNPVSGYLAEGTNRTWPMLNGALFAAGFSFLLLGPAPFLPFECNIWVNFVGLVIIGASVGISVIAMDAVLHVAWELGYENNLYTYGLVCGVWGSAYSFGEALGPYIGGCLYQYCGFAIASTIMAYICILTGILVFIFNLFMKETDTKVHFPSSANISMKSPECDSGLGESGSNSPLQSTNCIASPETFRRNGEELDSVDELDDDDSLTADII